MPVVPFNGDARETLVSCAIDEFMSDLGAAAQSRIHVVRDGVLYITLRGVGYWEPLATHPAWIEVPLNPLCSEAIELRRAAECNCSFCEQPMIDEDPCIKLMRENR